MGCENNNHQAIILHSTFDVVKAPFEFIFMNLDLTNVTAKYIVYDNKTKLKEHIIGEGLSKDGNKIIIDQYVETLKPGTYLFELVLIKNNENIKKLYGNLVVHQYGNQVVTIETTPPANTGFFDNSFSTEFN